jgi:hypothetical protein
VRGSGCGVLRPLGAAVEEDLQAEAAKDGYGYLTRATAPARDRVRLRAAPARIPTLIEYSGYGYANPAGAQSGISPIANLLGFAVVDVNMRGTGCSAARSTSSSRSRASTATT